MLQNMHILYSVYKTKIDFFLHRELDELHEKQMESEGQLDSIRKVQW